jgi:hypothetical protein
MANWAPVKTKAKIDRFWMLSKYLPIAGALVHEE